MIAAATLLIGGALGWYAGPKHGPALPSPVEVRKNTTPQYDLIDPLVFTDSDQRFFTEYDQLDKQIDGYVKNAEDSFSATSVSVYYRDLNNGHWTGTNEDETFEPSSMLKVAVMISYLLDAISNQDILSKQIYYSGKDESGQYYTSSTTLSQGYHTVQELIDNMIINSDNVAALALISNDQNTFQAVYNDFRLPPTPEGPVTDYMTAKSYSVIFRALYNASYLTRTLSQRALQLLTRTGFTKGLVAGVPKGTVVAHKFGEHTYSLSDGTPVSRELHDCGIVYYPDHPYLLCIMTKGKDFPALESVISGISSLVYDYVNESQAK